MCICAGNADSLIVWEVFKDEITRMILDIIEYTLETPFKPLRRISLNFVVN